MNKIFSSLRGQVMALSKVNDDVFPSVCWAGGAACPQESILRAPFGGTAMMFLPTVHAIGLLNDDGLELLIHIGINTVNLNGQHFSSALKVGDKIESGRALIRFDRAAIELAGYDLITPVIVINDDRQHQLHSTAAVQVEYGELLMTLSTREVQA